MFRQGIYRVMNKEPSSLCMWLQTVTSDSKGIGSWKARRLQVVLFAQLRGSSVQLREICMCAK